MNIDNNFKKFYGKENKSSNAVVGEKKWHMRLFVFIFI